MKKLSMDPFQITCTQCGVAVKDEDFCSTESFREFSLNGLCLRCQLLGRYTGKDAGPICVLTEIDKVQACSGSGLGEV